MKPNQRRCVMNGSTRRLELSSCHSLAPRFLWRQHFSSAYHSPGDCHSPATAILQRLPSSSDYHTPATAILQRLPSLLRRGSSLFGKRPQNWPPPNWVPKLVPVFRSQGAHFWAT